MKELRILIPKCLGTLLIFVIILSLISSKVYASSIIQPLVTSPQVIIVTSTSSVSSPTSQSQESNDEDAQFRSESRNWFQKMWDSVSDIKVAVTEVVASIKEIFTEGLSHLVDITVGSILQGMYLKVADGMSKWVYSTPKLIGFKWIKDLWYLAYIISIVEIVAALILTAYGAILGKERKSGEPFDPKKIAVIFLGVIIGTYFSLFAADVVITFKNEAINSLVSATLYEQYQDYKDEPYITKDLKIEDMKFENFTGDALCRMAYGLKSDAANPGKPIYKAFVDSSGGYSSLINMSISMLLLSILGLFGMLLNIVIGALGAFGPFWIGWCMVTGNYDPAYGWINLFSRSVLVTAIFDAAWLAAVKVNSKYLSEFNGAGQALTSLFFFIAIILAAFFWLKWIGKAFIKPLTLGGAAAREWWGDKTEAAGKYLENTGNHYGISKLSHKGSEMQAVGKEQQAIAKEKREENYDWNKGNIKDRLRNVRLEHERQYVRQEGAVKAGYIKSAESKENSYEGVLKAFSMAGVDNGALYKKLSENGFSGVVNQAEDGQVMIDSAYLKDAQNKMKDSFEKDYIAKDSILNDSIGFKVQGLSGEKLAEVESTMNEADIKYEKLYDLAIDNDKVNELKETAIKFEEFYNSNSHNVSEEDFEHGKAGYAFPFSGEQAKAATALFQSNNIRSKKKGNKIIVNASDFDSALERNAQLVNTISGLKKDDNGQYLYKSMNAENYESLKDKLNRAAIEYKVKESLWADNEDKDFFLESIGKAGENEIEYTQDIQYISYKIPNNRDCEKIKEELINSTKIPKEALVKVGNEKRGYLNIDKEYSDEAKKIIEAYWERTPYWEGSDGYYYYKEGRSNKIVAHLSKPQDNGRYMGKK